jgi:small-conductance mechanosensitive channel
VNAHRLISDIAGLTAIASAAASVTWALTYFKVLSSPLITALIGVPILAGVALYVWYVSVEGRKADAEQWMMGTIFTPFIGAISFAIDVLVGSTGGHFDNFVQAAFHAGSPFGIVLTVFICPVGTIICLGGWLRCGLLQHFNPKSDIED